MSYKSVCALCDTEHDSGLTVRPVSSTSSFPLNNTGRMDFSERQNSNWNFTDGIKLKMAQTLGLQLTHFWPTRELFWGLWAQCQHTLLLVHQFWSWMDIYQRTHTLAWIVNPQWYDTCLVSRYVSYLCLRCFDFWVRSFHQSRPSWFPHCPTCSTTADMLLHSRSNALGRLTALLLHASSLTPCSKFYIKKTNKPTAT